MRTTILLVLTICLITATTSCSQEQDSNDLNSLATQSFTAIQQGDWNSYVALLHPDASEQFKGILMPVFEMVAFRDTAFYKVAGQYFGLTLDSGQVVDTPADEFMVSFLDSIFAVIPGLKEGMTNADYAILGDVPEGDTLRHVIYRMSTTFQDVPVTSIEAASFRATNDGWRLQLSQEMKGLADRIAQMITQGR